MLRAFVVVLVVVSVIGGSALMTVGGSAPTVDAQMLGEPPASVAACDAAVPIGDARCHSLIRTDSRARGQIPPRLNVPSAATTGMPGAYDPSYLQSAYNLASLAASAGGGQTVAIVDAFDAPTAESDLAFYRTRWALPPCTSGNGCFRKVNQIGVAGQYPTLNASWAEEISLDVDMVSAICPNCSILLVEANSNNLVDLGTSVNTAARLGAMVISNSYGGGEYSGEALDEVTYYQHPGIAITASSGDKGFGTQFPAASQYVTAVGGTSLQQMTNTGVRNATEIVWPGAGSGCSSQINKPGWQLDTGCTRRTVADVAAVADPNTGVWVYDTTPVGGQSGWLVIGGTSVAAPIVGAIYGLAGGGSNRSAAIACANTASLFDIVKGSNGSCGGSYLCTGGVGYDGPTGLGSANGTRAFGGAFVAATNTPTSTLTPTSTPTSTPTAGGSSTTLGLISIGSVQDTADSNYMTGSRVVTNAQSMSVTSIFAYVGAVGSAPNNQFSVAIFNDAAGSPGALVAQSATGTLTANAWNTLAITAVLSPNTAYWLMYNANGTSGAADNLVYNNDPSNVGAYAPRPFGSWPSSFGNSSLAGQRYSMYVIGQ